MSTLLLGATADDSAKPIQMASNMLTRHGLISGATGTGKTITLQVLAEQLALEGITVLACDVKGDLAGLSEPGTPHAKISERVQHIGIDEFYQVSFPTIFWDLFGQRGHPVRTTVTEM